MAESEGGVWCRTWATLWTVARWNDKTGPPLCAPKWLLLHRCVYCQQNLFATFSATRTLEISSGGERSACVFAELRVSGTEYIPLSYMFQSGSSPTLKMPRFGRSCMRMQPSFVRLDHFPLNLPPFSSARSCSRHDWHSRGPHRVYELCRTSRSQSTAGPQNSSKI
jgi:hypothetical protein